MLHIWGLEAWNPEKIVAQLASDFPAPPSWAARCHPYECQMIALVVVVMLAKASSSVDTCRDRRGAVSAAAAWKIPSRKQAFPLE